LSVLAGIVLCLIVVFLPRGGGLVEWSIRVVGRLGLKGWCRSLNVVLGFHLLYLYLYCTIDMYWYWINKEN